MVWRFTVSYRRFPLGFRTSTMPQFMGRPFFLQLSPCQSLIPFVPNPFRSPNLAQRKNRSPVTRLFLLPLGWPSAPPTDGGFSPVSIQQCFYPFPHLSSVPPSQKLYVATPHPQLAPRSLLRFPKVPDSFSPGSEIFTFVVPAARTPTFFFDKIRFFCQYPRAY